MYTSCNKPKEKLVTYFYSSPVYYSSHLTMSTEKVIEGASLIVLQNVMLFPYDLVRKLYFSQAPSWFFTLRYHTRQARGVIWKCVCHIPLAACSVGREQVRRHSWDHYRILYSSFRKILSTLGFNLIDNLTNSLRKKELTLLVHGGKFDRVTGQTWSCHHATYHEQLCCIQSKGNNMKNILNLILKTIPRFFFQFWQKQVRENPSTPLKRAP